MDLHRLPGADIGCRTSQSAIVSHRMGDYAFMPTIFPVNGFSSIPRLMVQGLRTGYTSCMIIDIAPTIRV
ncbi:unnamed protein product [Sphagnum troendelagicum]|uniref:Uncharacterized protein n=1 Tax=Sphagnum troendelagicum TaxID=128251 RepID=A0ABP0U7Q9_9BRYO